MKWITVALFAGLLSFANAQEINVEITGNIFNTDSDSIYISHFFGDRYEDLVGTKFKKNGDFKFKTKLANPDYYVLRFGDSHVNLILRDSAKIKVYGDGSNIEEFANIIGSDASAKMNQFLRVERNWKAVVDSANAVLEADPSKQAELNRSLQGRFQQYQATVRQFIQENPNSPALLPVLGVMSPVQDFEGYENILQQLMAGFGDSPTVQSLYANLETIKKERIASDPLAPGKEAPDFTEKLPSGETMSLSDLRGKVVLLDFWASWCGPCRRENPSVVALYKKYKDRGFTVMSVSLDKDRERWLAAIEKDNLIWPNHVSDLGGWQSQSPKFYGVSSIPFTVLIDREGNIIKTKLRGPQLEEELARIFGDS